MSWNKITEMQNPISSGIDEKPVIDILNIINSEDAQVATAVKKTIPEIKCFIDKLIDCLHNGGRFFYVGSGTSGRLGVLDAVECPPTFSTKPEMIEGIIAGGYDALVRSIEGAEDSWSDGAKAISKKSITKRDVVMGISASNSTPFVMGALEKAKKEKALTCLLICNKSPDLPYVDHILTVIVGPEVITGSTRMKSGTATKMVLNMITTTAMIKLNKTFGNLMVDLKASNKKLWDRGARIVSHLTDLNYDDSLQLLKSADGEVKTAIVMNKSNIKAKDARKILDNNFGSLREAISHIRTNLLDIS